MNNHGAPDAKSYNKCKQSWDEKCRHQTHAGCKYTAPHLCWQRRRCWELKICNHSSLFAQNLQVKLRKKMLLLSERIQMQHFPLCLVISADLCKCNDLFLVSKLLFNAHRQKAKLPLETHVFGRLARDRAAVFVGKMRWLNPRECLSWRRSGWINNLSKLCCWPGGRHVVLLKNQGQRGWVQESEHRSLLVKYYPHTSSFSHWIIIPCKAKNAILGLHMARLTSEDCTCAAVNICPLVSSTLFKTEPCLLDYIATDTLTLAGVRCY